MTGSFRSSTRHLRAWRDDAMASTSVHRSVRSEENVGSGVRSGKSADSQTGIKGEIVPCDDCRFPVLLLYYSVELYVWMEFSAFISVS